MTTIQILEGIRSILDSTKDPQEGVTLAAAYALRCQEANKRLLEFARLVNSGQDVDGLALADQPPALRDLCRELTFPQAAEWKLRCQSETWPVADSLDASALELLTTTESSGLQPEALMRALRGAARQKDLRKSVWILRKLRQAQPENNDHARDLQDFEIRRISEIRGEFQRATQNAQEDSIVLLEAEVLSPGWHAPFPADLKSAISSAAAAIRQRESLENAQTWIAALSMAYSNNDLAKAIPLRQRLETLFSDTHFVLPTDLEQEWKDDQLWVNERLTEQKKETEFAKIITLLECAVRERNAPEAIRLLGEANLIEKNLPHGLKESADSLVQDWETQQDRVRKRNTFIVVALLVCVVGLAAFVGRQAMMSKRVETMSQILKPLIERDDLVGLIKESERIQKLEPEIWGQPEIQDLIIQTNAVAKRVTALRIKFETQFRSLEQTLTNENWNELSQTEFAKREGIVNQQLDEMDKQLARNEEEQKIVSDASVKWGDILAKRRDYRKQSWNTWWTELQELLQGLEPIEASEDESVSLDALAAVQSHLNNTIDPPDEAASAQLQQVAARIQTMVNSMESMDQQIARMLVALTLDQYMTELETYVSAFTSSPLASKLKPIVDHKSGILAIQESVLSAKEDNPIWGSVVQRQSIKTSNTLSWETIRSDILSWENDKQLVQMYESDYLNAMGQKVKAYFVDYTPPSGQWGIGKQPVLSFLVPLDGSQRDTEAEFMVREIDNRILNLAKRSPHCSVLDKLISDIRLTQPHQAYEVVLTQTRNLLTKQEVPALLRRLAAMALVDHLIILAPASEKATLEAAKAELLTVDPAMSWLNIGHPHYRATSERTVASLRSVTFHLDRLMGKKRWSAYDLTVSNRQPIWIGHWDLVKNEPLYRTEGNYREIWVIRQHQGAPRIFIANDNAAENSTWRVKPHPGEPLFSPKNGETTKEALQRLKTAGGEIPIREILEEKAWPVNYVE